MSTPPTVTIRRAKGRPAQDPGVDFAMCIIGSSSANPLATGALSLPYYQPTAFVDDYAIGDGVDAVCHALTETDDNPQPPGVSFLSTLALSSTAQGVRGATLDVSAMTGSAVPTKTAATYPLGTWEPAVRVADDGNNGAGGTVGTAGIILEASLDAGRTWMRTFALGVATDFEVKIPNPGATDYDTGIHYDLEPSAGDKTALYTKLNSFKTTVVAHFTIVSGSPQVHLTADNADAATLTAIASASTPATAVTLYNGIFTILGQHGASAVYHTTADAQLATALAALTPAMDVGDVELGLNALISAYNTHRQHVASPSPAVHGSADGTNTITAFTASPGTLFTGDIWYESKTTPPQFSVDDLYTAGSPPTGALITIASSAQNFGMVALTEPVAASDIAILSDGLDAMTERNPSCRPTLICRFRDQASGESDAVWLAALATFRAACASDARIHVVAGDGWLTDAFRSLTYSRSGLPAVLARIQGHAALPGVKGERVAQAPGWTARGPLVGFSVRDTAGNPTGHDERTRGGALGPFAGKGGFGCFYYESATEVKGTYYCVDAPVLYDVLPSVLTLMDNRVSSGIERALYLIAFSFIGGAAVVNAGVIDEDTRDSMASAAKAVIKKGYANEIANAEDPNLVTVDPNVTVNGAVFTVKWYVNDALFRYLNGVIITVFNKRV